jgi:hypothetical protein
MGHVNAYVRSYTYKNDNFKTCPEGVPVKVDHLNAESMAHVFSLNFFNEA